jgi:hypothetical protein
MSNDNVTLGSVTNCNGALSVEFNLPDFFAAAASISPEVEKRTVNKAMVAIGADDSELSPDLKVVTAHFLNVGVQMSLGKLLEPANGMSAVRVVDHYVQQAKPKCL